MPWGEITQFSFSAPPHRPGVCASVQLLNDPRTFGGAYPFRKEFEINSKCRLQVYKSSGASPEALTSGEQFRKLLQTKLNQCVVDILPQTCHTFVGAETGGAFAGTTSAECSSFLTQS
jgi:hypothetical protein